MVRCAAAWVADPEGGAGVGTVRTDRLPVTTVPLTAWAAVGFRRIRRGLGLPLSAG
jgi:hypothetical protein